MKEETKKTVGEFERRGGQKLRVSTGDTVDGKSCLLHEVPSSGLAASCLENGLFAVRKVAFLVSSEGGPEQYRELYVAGVVSPSVNSISLSQSDGSTVAVRLNSDRAFLFESSALDLERGVVPSALRLYGTSGKLVQEVKIPPAQ